MKFVRILCLSFLYLGMILILLGLIAATLPLLENEQIQLILASFEAPANNALLGFVNQLFLGMIRHHIGLLIAGGSMTVLSILCLFIFTNSGAAPKTSHSSHAYQSLSNSIPDPSAASATKASGNWRRPATADLELDAWKDSALPNDPFASGPLEDEACNPPSAPDPSQDANPYLTYGQSTYAPPAKPEAEKDEVVIPPQFVSILPSTLKDPLPPGETISHVENGQAKQINFMQPPKTFHIPSLAAPPPRPLEPASLHEPTHLQSEARSTEVGHGSALGAMPPIRIRSTVAATDKPAAPPLLPLEELAPVAQNVLTDESEELQKPHFLSKRIRSTIGINAP